MIRSSNASGDVSSIEPSCLAFFCNLFPPCCLNITRRSKIVSRATGRYAATSFDQLLVCPRSSFVGVA